MAPIASKAASVAGLHSKVRSQSMSDSKPFASLGPILLARKGGARPCPHSALGEPPLESANDEDEGMDFADDPARYERPAIKHQQEHLLHRIADANDAALNRHLSAIDGEETGRRVAFTLRLDAERHLKLKLASAIEGESAQSLLTRALDRMLDEMPDIETIAARIARDEDKA